MAKLIGWHNPEDTADQWDGFNDSGIETFAGKPMRSLAREVTQNALDARVDGVVRLDMLAHRVKTSTIPDLKELKASLKACLIASKDESPKAQIFFRNALGKLDAKDVNVLEISDFNTHGMTGPCAKGTPYFAFMKAKGQSKKDSQTAAGSFGIGKFAPYSASGIRTIFVSTVFSEKPKSYSQFSQGKSILMSHDAGGKRRQGVGYWGVIDRCQPVAGLAEELPDWLRRCTKKNDFRKSLGSKLTVLCFDKPDSWEESLAISAAENFFGAIHAGTLRVNINSKHLLDKSTIADFFANKAIGSALAELDYEQEQFLSSASYLDALSDGPEVIVEDSETKEFGHIQLRILVREGLHKKVCFLRNGMFITDNLDRLRNFPDFKDFVAIVQCVSEKGNRLLRAMEPPKHDTFEPERLPTPEEQKKGAQALKDLAKWVREMLRRHAKDPVSEVTQIDELKDFFSEMGSESSEGAGEEINPFGKVTLHPRPLPLRKSSAKDPASEDAEDGNGEGEGGGGGSGGGGGDGEGGKGKAGKGGKGGTSQKKSFALTNVRTVIFGPRERTVAFTPEESGNARLSIMQAGADTDYPVAISSSTIGTVAKGAIVLDLKKGERQKIKIAIDQDYDGAVKVVAHEV